MLYRVFPEHSYPTSGRITIPHLSTKIRIDDVKIALQRFVEIWSVHMGPMDFKKSAWTAILEYCDIRDAGRALADIRHSGVRIHDSLVREVEADAGVQVYPPQTA